jgi:hypothetical protein
MKKYLPTLLLPLVLALSACGTPSDQKYNEAVTPAFLHNVQIIDQDMERLISGELDAGHPVDPGKPIPSPRQRIDALEQDLNQVQQLSHSDAASKFASNLSRYYELQISYYQQLGRYTRTSDKAQQESLAHELNDAYRVLKAAPEQILLAQKQFVKQADLPL